MNKSNFGSEHTINGQHFAMEMHIVSLNLDQATKSDFVAAVTGVLFRLDDTLPADGSFADKFMQKLLNTSEVIDFQADFVDHLDFNHRYHYKGSLTTPPYTEGLFWTVLATPVPVRSETVDLFASHFTSEIAVGASNRDV